MTAQHAKISPSSLNYRKQCRAYEPTHTDNAAATEGTLLHAAIENEFFDALDAEQMELVNKCLGFLKPMKKGADEIHNELRVNIEMGPHTTFGTADVVIIKGNLCYLVDFKFGRNSVPDASQNLQAAAYALGVFDAFPAIDEIQVWFLLPRRDETSHCTLHRKDLVKVRKTLETLYDEVTQASPPRTPSSACQYCNLAGECSELTGSALSLKSGLEPITIPDDKMPSEMTPEVLDTIALPLARVMGAWCDAVKRRATELAMNGHEFDNHKLVTRARAVNIDDVQCAYEQVKDIIPLDDFLRATKLSVSQLRSVAKSLAPRGKGKAAAEEINSRLATLMPNGDEAETRYLRKK
tara:strand:+ start:5502 stop:6557 length:1056 start_codon:yes stop_codon:yes gene_type:complete